MEKKENKASAILMNIDIVVASIILAILIVLTFLGMEIYLQRTIYMA